MRRALTPLLLAGIVLAAVACVDASNADVPQVMEVVGTPALEGEMPRGVYVVIPPEHADDPGAPQTDVMYAGEIIIYMNRLGGTYTPGFNDARTNRSSVPNQTTTIPPWNVSEAGWAQVMECMRNNWAPFNVVITDVDPGNVPHFESIVAGHPNDVGFPNGVGGVSPFTSDCSVIDNSIVFTFAEVYGSNYQAICETAAQEVAHSFGLDHEFLCADPMTYLGGCGAKTFQNTDAPCGEGNARVCACGGATQNSVGMLLSRIGPAQEITPDVNITRPSNGQSVAPGFIVEIAVDASLTIDHVEMFIDDTLIDTLYTKPYVFNAPTTLNDGSHVVETRAIDSNNNVGSAQINVTQSASDPDPDPDPDNPSLDNDLVGGCAVGNATRARTSFALIVLGLGLALVRRRRVERRGRQ